MVAGRLNLLPPWRVFVFSRHGSAGFYLLRKGLHKMDRNLTFWADEGDSRELTFADNRNVSRCWCDPSLFSDVVGVDFGGGEMHCYSSAQNRLWRVPVTSAMQEILGFQSQTLVVAESAHLATPRTKTSLAQPFTADDLLDLYARSAAREIIIKLFPHYHSGIRARAWAASRFPGLQSAQKADAADAMALALYVLHCNAVSLANPPVSFSRDTKRDYGKAVRQYSSIALNAERTSGYAGHYFPKLIKLGCDIYHRRGKSIGEKACHSIASLIATEVNGVPFLFARNGRVLGVHSWWRHVARMTPFHHHGGLARSNLMRHSFRPFLRKFGKRHGVPMGAGSKVYPFGEHDDRQATVRTRAMRCFRDTIKDCYRVGVDVAVQQRFEMIDPVQTPWSEVAGGQCEYRIMPGGAVPAGG